MMQCNKGVLCYVKAACGEIHLLSESYGISQDKRRGEMEGGY